MEISVEMFGRGVGDRFEGCNQKYFSKNISLKKCHIFYYIFYILLNFFYYLIFDIIFII